jgi:hypothetical protein
MHRAIAFVVAAGAFLVGRVASAAGAVSYEVREEIAAVLLPSHDYPVSGNCSTGTGVAPASVYAQGGSGRGVGVGVGVGGRVGFEVGATLQGERALRWWAFRAGTGLDLSLLYANVPTGIPDMTGKLCARVKADGAAVGYQGSAVLLAQLPLLLGGEFALATDSGSESSHGVVLGAAWAPSIGYLKPWVADASLDASFLGAELTIDFASWRPAAAPARQSSKRVALFLVLPARDQGPLIVTASFGAVWN